VRPSRGKESPCHTVPGRGRSAGQRYGSGRLALSRRSGGKAVGQGGLSLTSASPWLEKWSRAIRGGLRGHGAPRRPTSRPTGHGVRPMSGPPAHRLAVLAEDRPVE
jgi:hypothetical protein